MPTGEWNEWGRHVLAEQKRLSTAIEKMSEQQTKILQRMSTIEGKLTILKIKMSGIGAVIGAALVKVLHQ